VVKTWPVDEETAFYEALEVNDSAVAVLGDETLRTIARELVAAVKRNVADGQEHDASGNQKAPAILRRSNLCTPQGHALDQNLEVGVLISGGGQAPRRLMEHFHALVAGGTLARV
jgi:Type I restriction enzyme HindI endonuclease subunit-like, C-terminal